eukprot:4589020-Prymnesium_polylepis.2
MPARLQRRCASLDGKDVPEGLTLAQYVDVVEPPHKLDWVLARVVRLVAQPAAAHVRFARNSAEEQHRIAVTLRVAVAS